MSQKQGPSDLYRDVTEPAGWRERDAEHYGRFLDAISPMSPAKCKHEAVRQTSTFVHQPVYQCVECEIERRLAESAAEIADLTQKLEDARKDAERFAWLDKQLLCADFYYGEDRVPVLVFSWPRHVGIGGNLRMNVDAAIDAAMKDAPYEQA